MDDEPTLTLHEWVLLRWWTLRAALRRCPECGARGYDARSPRWEEDRVALMIDVAHFGCPCCGAGAVEERNAVRGTE